MALFLPVHLEMKQSALGCSMVTLKGDQDADATSGPMDVENRLPNIKKLKEL